MSRPASVEAQEWGCRPGCRSLQEPCSGPSWAVLAVFLMSCLCEMLGRGGHSNVVIIVLMKEQPPRLRNEARAMAGSSHWL